MKCKICLYVDMCHFVVHVKLYFLRASDLVKYHAIDMAQGISYVCYAECAVTGENSKNAFLFIDKM